MVLIGAAVAVYVADQLAKAWAVASLLPEQPRHLIGSVLQLNLIRNPGAAFSIGTGYTWILTLVACSVVAVILATSRRLGSLGWAWALGLLLGGSLGNLTDRMVRPPGPGRGHVVDFLQLPHWPIFNIADSAVVSAAVLIALLALRGIGVDGARAAQHERQALLERGPRRWLTSVRWPSPTGSRASGSTPLSPGCSASPAPRPPTWPRPAR